MNINVNDTHAALRRDGYLELCIPIKDGTHLPHRRRWWCRLLGHKRVWELKVSDKSIRTILEREP
jgi:hypothetical protein